MCSRLGLRRSGNTAVVADGINAEWTYVRVLFCRLDPLVARALELSYFRGFTQPEIARELQVPRESVSRLLSTGLRELAALLTADARAKSVQVS